MRVPITPAQGTPSGASAIPSDTMLAMAAAIMHQQGKLDSLITDPYDPPKGSQAQADKLGIEIRREMDDAGMKRGDPRGEKLGPGNEYVPGNKGLLGQWNRRT